MAKRAKQPSKASVSAASMKGKMNPHEVEHAEGNKRTSQNQQYKQHNMQGYQ
ncbi:YuzL family protein [Bacillus sp. HMF5848]|uniref:YuzL family protein n=1 Tax=Bacillus sp. HMF5848 TaxID=2495421 RepID=UPI000F79D1F2|nr:YuzL family protein [Bacillus sp. HMF5848]RSK28473.1 YuzL family protein [Bacillus sp. HMF5848]